MSKSKSIISILVGMLLVVSLVGCSGDKGMYTPGTYTGVAAGHNGDVKVEVEVDADKILSVKVLDNEETEGIADPAIEKVPAAIVEKQSLSVDVVSGATVTSEAILEATKTALKESGADIEKLTK